MSMRLLRRATAALFLASTPAMADGPVFTRAGGIAGSAGASPAWAIGSGGDAHFATGTIAGSPVVTAGTLASTAAPPEIAVVGRSLAARFSDSLNVRDYGAMCDGVTDDYVPLQDAVDVATGHIVGSTTLTPQQKLAATLAVLDGRGPNPSGAARIVVPGSACVSSHALVATLNGNSMLGLVGDGQQDSELVFTGPTDGLDINYAAASPSTNGNDGAHNGGNWKGQGIYVADIGFVTAYQGDNTKATTRALAINAIALTLANAPPFSVIRNVSFRTRDGYDGRMTEGWGFGLQFQNADNLYMDNVQSVASGPADTIGFSFPSTYAAGDSSGHGLIDCFRCGALGGFGYFDVPGAGYQAITLDHGFAVTSGPGSFAIRWVAPSQSLSGSLVVSNGSFKADSAIVKLTNIGTVFSHDNFYYNTSPLPGQDFHGVQMVNVDWVNQHGDTIVLGAAGAQGAGHLGYGETIDAGVSGPTTYDGQPSLVAGVTVSGGDVGFQGQGANLRVQDGICYATATCYQDTYAGTDARFHPQFLAMTTTDQVTWADDGQAAQMIYGAATRRFASGFELGMPGITSPAGQVGYAGGIDWHSVAAASIAAQNDYDCREVAVGGVAGSSGQGALSFYCAGGINLYGPLSATTGRFSGTLLDPYGVVRSGGTNMGTFDSLIAGSTAPNFDYRQIVGATQGAAAGTDGTGTLYDFGTGGRVMNGPLSVPTATLTTGILDTPAGVPLNINAPFVNETMGPVVAQAFRVNGFAFPASPTAACNTGTFGFGLSPAGMVDLSYCATSGTSLYAPLLAGARGGGGAGPGGSDTAAALIDGAPGPGAGASGLTVTATDDTGGQILVCSGTLASLTEVLPANPRPKMTFHLTSECSVTTLTVAGGTSSAGVTATVVGAPTSIAPGSPATFVYDNDRSVWARW